MVRINDPLQDALMRSGGFVSMIALPELAQLSWIAFRVTGYASVTTCVLPTRLWRGRQCWASRQCRAEQESEYRQCFLLVYRFFRITPLKSASQL